MQSDESQSVQPSGRIRIGMVELVSVGDRVLIVHHGKRQRIETEIAAAVIERWCVRQLREAAFA